jgi:hypothetical protein
LTGEGIQGIRRKHIYGYFSPFSYSPYTVFISCLYLKILGYDKIFSQSGNFF